MKKYTEAELSQKLESYDSWIYDVESGKIVAGFEFQDFEMAMAFANEVGNIAEEISHHPDILIHDYNKLTVFTSTHDVNGISDKDFELVEKIEQELNSAENLETE